MISSTSENDDRHALAASGISTPAGGKGGRNDLSPVEMRPVSYEEPSDDDIGGHHSDNDDTHTPQSLTNRHWFVVWRSETQAATVAALATTLVFSFIVLGRIFWGDEANWTRCNNSTADATLLQQSLKGTLQERLQETRAAFRASTSADNIAQWAAEFSSKPHHAGSARNRDLATRTAQLFRDFGLDVRTQTFPTLLTNTTRRRLRRFENGILLPDLDLDEVNIEHQLDWADALPASNGFSGSGIVRAPLVWVNYGRAEDFDMIHSVNLSGKIVIVRYGKVFRGDKVKLAAERGAAGVIITHDPADMKLGRAFPDGPWATNSTVQRGSVSLTEGDVLTPTWPAEFGGPTISQSDLFDEAVMGKGLTLPRIPVLPISFGNAMRILPGIGNGSNSHALPSGWADSGFLAFLSSGVGPGDAVVELEVRRELQWYNVTNVFGMIHGEHEPEKAVLMGSHRDAWTYGTADAISGHSTMLEVARALGAMVKDPKAMWRPRRSIQFCSWDAEEWSIIGSIEYVETNAELLRQRAVAYLNMDIAVSGSEVLSLSGSPLLETVAMLASEEVLLPNGSLPLSSMVGPFTPPGSGSDHVGFIQVAGVPVLDSSFENRTSSYEAVYHSNYDNVGWMIKFGDPGYRFHERMAQFQGTMILLLADSAVVPMYVERYAFHVDAWVNRFAQDRANHFADFSFILDSVRLLSAACDAAKSRRADAMQLEDQAESLVSAARAIDRVNRVSTGLERVFIGRGSVDSGQAWYLHVIFTPSAVDFYSASTMPLIADALRTKDAVKSNFAIGRVAQFIRRAATFVNETAVGSPWYASFGL